MRGKEKCKALKELRAKIAEDNNIEYAVTECSHKGECRGTCPKCESELRYLERELEKKRRLGEKVCAVGISLGGVFAMAGCTPEEFVENTLSAAVPPVAIVKTIIENGNETPPSPVTVMGDVTEPEDEPLMGDVTESEDNPLMVEDVPEEEIMGDFANPEDDAAKPKPYVEEYMGVPPSPDDYYSSDDMEYTYIPEDSNDCDGDDCEDGNCEDCDDDDCEDGDCDNDDCKKMQQ